MTIFIRSKSSVQRLDLKPSFERIRFAGEALQWKSNLAICPGRIRLEEHHWGKRGLRILNVLAMVGSKPEVRFQEVKMLDVDQVREYIW